MQTERTAMLALRLAAVGLTLAGNMAPGLALAAGSGGYSRPSISRSSPAVRAPSVTSFPRPSTSSTGGSGGYRRPAERAPSTLSRSTSAGDAEPVIADGAPIATAQVSGDDDEYPVEGLGLADLLAEALAAFRAI